MLGLKTNPREERLALPPTELSLRDTTALRLRDADQLQAPRERARRYRRGPFEILGAMVAVTWRWVATLAVLALLAGAGYGVWNFFVESPFFEVAEISFLGADQKLISEVRALSGLDEEDSVNLLLLNVGELAERLESHPRVRWVEIRKFYPSVLQIQVQERTPIAILTTEPMFLVDNEGVAIDEVGAGGLSELPALPFVSGIPGAAVTLGERVADKTLPRLLVIWQTLQRANPQFAKLVSEFNTAQNENGLQMILEGGVRVLLGRNPNAQQLAFCEAFLEKTQNARDIALIDLRFDNQIVYTLKEIPSDD